VLGEYVMRRKGKVVAIIQARMGSSRLPGKILKPLAGQPVLYHMIERLSFCTSLDEVVIATTLSELDNAVEDFCHEHDVSCFRGSEKDVLDRYYKAALQFNADHIVRITADCPAIDPFIVDEVVHGYLEGDYDIYCLGGNFPNGLDCTVFSFSALDEAAQCATLPSEREHVGPYLEKHTEKFKQGYYIKYDNLWHHRWTLDEPEDYMLLTKIFDHLYQPGTAFTAQNVIDLMDTHPEYPLINSAIIRNEGYLKSLKEDEAYLE